MKYFFTLIILPVFIAATWDINFVKRIVHFVRIYRKCRINAKTDPFGNFAEAARNYKVEIVTHVFLLIINITEFITLIMYMGGLTVNYRNSFSNSTYFINGEDYEALQFPSFEFKLTFANPFFRIIVSTAQVSLLFSIAFGICLVKYLHISYHELSINPFKIIKRFLLITSLLSISLIISGSIPQLIMIECLVEPIILFVYFCIWVKCNRTFYGTLQWRRMEFKIRGRSNWIVRRSVINCQQFGIIMSCIGFILACIILAQFLTQKLFLNLDSSLRWALSFPILLWNI